MPSRVSAGRLAFSRDLGTPEKILQKRGIFDVHATLIVSTTPMLVPAMTGVAFLTWFVALTVALWVMVAAVAVSDSRQRSGQQIRVRPV